MVKALDDIVSPVPAGSTAAETRSPFDRVYRGVLRGLYEGRFVPGQRLIARDLMREFDVGRGTIREVLQRLASTGVVRITPHRSAEVCRLTRSEVAEVLDLVEVLLGLAARKAAGGMSGRSAALLLQRQYDVLAAQKFDEDFAGFVVARESYYRTLIAAAGSRELQRIFPAIQVHIMRVQLRIYDRAGDAADPADFQLLHEAIMSGHPEAAEAAGRLHVQRTIGRIARLPDRAFESDEWSL